MKIFVTRRIPKPGLDLLRKEHELEIYKHDRVPTKKEIIKGLKGKDGLLCLLTDPIDKEVIYSEPKLKMIANYAVGYNNIDVKAATERDIPVSNTPDVLTDTTAEMAWALLFSVARRIVEGDRFTRAGEFNGWAPMLMLGQDVSNKTLGVVGAGRIGTAFALKSKGFNMKVLYFDEKKNQMLEDDLGAKKVDLHRLLKESDYVSLHVPLVDATYHMIGEKELRMMKKNSILVNTSRGPVVDEKALIKALKEKWIFGAGLDVYEYEPVIPKELLKLDNVVLQPHSASATIETRTKMALIAAENMMIGLKGEIPPNCINPEVFRRKTGF
ncbi:MAG: D-glycerate dehydrogenase [Candidatus Thermoplasmatota archaeon]|jgi:lactate dehydrogenase-like 2-hydroxyacid dehydrogenase|nr:D-glycerate dehydrogenase [Candidatus Thermoplasmatota archaeon]